MRFGQSIVCAHTKRPLHPAYMDGRPFDLESVSVFGGDQVTDSDSPPCVNRVLNVNPYFDVFPPYGRYYCDIFQYCGIYLLNFNWHILNIEECF